jgi:hypothetical protein
MGKNLKEIQSMIDDRYERKIQVGYTGKTQRKEGEKWTDGNGTEWEIINGKRKQITSVPARGFDRCSDCDKIIFKQRDENTYNRMGRCYYCQINFEVDLKAKGKWKDWVIKQEKMRWESIEKEVVAIMKDIKNDTDQAFDKSIANVMANENISMAIEQHKK